LPYTDELDEYTYLWRQSHERLQQLRSPRYCSDIDELASPALAHARLARQMKYVGCALQQRLQIDVLQGGLDERESRTVAHGREVGFLDDAGVVIGEAVDSHYGGSRVQERGGEMRANETGSSGDQSLHDNSSRMYPGSRRGRPVASMDA
jgi:hypothetical protein